MSYDIKELDINEGTLIGDIAKKYPSIREFLIELSPKFEKLKNPILFKAMSSKATIALVSEKSGFEVEDLINMIKKHIEDKNI
ncbi:DUF1858 domain-containing protein [Clostridium fungisolvens]|uniref:DUF1858 domain-containing protein n=1 Tax=Clostridium fungisolvens TaxID=1604897 RepID=A0A6V8SEH6_9CLOT|nr:DUF1858 domain-containing protein [Clostridium fungisolvens]GFP75221.1 hypothetical protein bsdtw1_01293 [Clostridium fungisolvens]